VRLCWFFIVFALALLLTCETRSFPATHCLWTLSSRSPAPTPSAPPSSRTSRPQRYAHGGQRDWRCDFVAAI
jgi:hypothetical protein